MKRLAKLSTVTAALATASVLVTGLGVAAADSISYGGPWSYNSYDKGSYGHSQKTRTIITNNNKIDLNNYTDQTAITGDARVSGNTRNKSHGDNKYCDYQSSYHSNKDYYKKPSHDYSNSYGGNGGRAQTGDANNYNQTQAKINLTNNTPSRSYGGNSYSNSYGSYGKNKNRPVLASYTNVTNNNDITINNYTEQYAQSGDATVVGNTRGGSAQTGDATNYNSTDYKINITNGSNRY